MTNISELVSFKKSGVNAFTIAAVIKTENYLKVLEYCLEKAKQYEDAQRWYIPVLERAIEDEKNGKKFINANTEDAICLFAHPQFEEIKHLYLS